MQVGAFWAWYDFWVGFYYDREKRKLYFCPFPMMVFSFQFESREERARRKALDAAVEQVLQRAWNTGQVVQMTINDDAEEPYTIVSHDMRRVTDAANYEREAAHLHARDHHGPECECADCIMGGCRAEAPCDVCRARRTDN